MQSGPAAERSAGSRPRGRLGLPAVDERPQRAERRSVQSVAGIGRRVWTIGADLADAASRTVGYARDWGASPTPTACWGAPASLRPPRPTNSSSPRSASCGRRPSDEGLASTLEEAAGLVAYLDRNGVLATPETFHRAPPPAVMEVRMRRVGPDALRARDVPEPIQPGRRRTRRDALRTRDRQPRRARMDAPPDGARPVGGVPARRGHGRPARRHVRVSRRAPAPLRLQRRDPGAAAPRSARRRTLRGRVSHRGPRGQPPRRRAGDRRRARVAVLHHHM